LNYKETKGKNSGNSIYIICWFFSNVLNKFIDFINFSHYFTCEQGLYLRFWNRSVGAIMKVVVLL